MAPDPQVRERVEEKLREYLLSGKLLPGVSVPIASLARRWGTSETPIREVGWRAVGEGWLTPEPRGGFRVWEPSVEDLRDLYQSLELLLIGTIGLLPATGQADISPPAEKIASVDGTSSLLAFGIRSRNGALLDLLVRTLDRLAPFRRAESQLLDDIQVEHRRLARVLADGSRSEMREAVRRYCGRRRSLAPAILGLLGEWARITDGRT